MQMDIRGRGMVVSDDLLGDVEERLRAAVMRLYPPVRALRVRIVDVNGPKGGEDKRVLVTAQGGAIHNTVVTARGTTVLGAVTAAADSLVRRARDGQSSAGKETRRARGRYERE